MVHTLKYALDKPDTAKASVATYLQALCNDGTATTAIFIEVCRLVTALLTVKCVARSTKLKILIVFYFNFSACFLLTFSSCLRCMVVA